jgi:hypothetical protein
MRRSNSAQNVLAAAAAAGEVGSAPDPFAAEASLAAALHPGGHQSGGGGGGAFGHLPRSDSACSLGDARFWHRMFDEPLPAEEEAGDEGEGGARGAGTLAEATLVDAEEPTRTLGGSGADLERMILGGAA